MESLPFRENNYVSMNIAIRPAYHRIGAYQRDADTAKRIGETLGLDGVRTPEHTDPAESIAE